MLTTPLLNNVFQVSYVTNDLDKAVSRFHDQYGAGEFYFMPDNPEATTDIALGMAGDTMIELLRPNGRAKDFYADWIEGIDGFALRFHHLGLLVDSKQELAAIRKSYADRGLSFPLEGEYPGFLDFFYVDARPELGHYLEYVRPEEGLRAMFANIPGSKFAA